LSRYRSAFIRPAELACSSGRGSDREAVYQTALGEAWGGLAAVLERNDAGATGRDIDRRVAQGLLFERRLALRISEQEQAALELSCVKCAAAHDLAVVHE
jgi:hypothetical protein